MNSVGGDIDVEIVRIVMYGANAQVITVPQAGTNGLLMK
jgi:hypothetical protein